jgi:hypothetical protein
MKKVSAVATKPEVSHAEQNGQAWAETILDQYLECQKAITDDNDTRREEIEESARESVLSVQVKSDWHNPGCESANNEFQILLSWGGPALRIYGELGQHNEPDNQYLQIQDWGTPWTEYHPEFTTEQDPNDKWFDALAWFTGLFYFDL